MWSKKSQDSKLREFCLKENVRNTEKRSPDQDGDYGGCRARFKDVIITKYVSQANKTFQKHRGS